MPDPLIDRRKFIRMGLITAASAIIPGNALASAYESVSGVRELHFYNLYTHEDLKIIYWREGWYIPGHSDRQGKGHQKGTAGPPFQYTDKYQC